MLIITFLYVDFPVNVFTWYYIDFTAQKEMKNWYWWWSKVKLSFAICQQEGKEDLEGGCCGGTSGGVCPGGGEVAGTGGQAGTQSTASASAAPVTPDSKNSPTQGGSRGGIKCSDKQAKKKKSKNKKNK